jgi:ATP-dependent Clp protease ATP-binding subunit ClpA
LSARSGRKSVLGIRQTSAPGDSDASIIAFHPLDRVDMKRIIDIQLSGLARRLEERKIQVVLTDAAKEQLVREGYDATYGARPLKRTIQRRVLDVMAMRMLEG